MMPVYPRSCEIWEDDDSGLTFLVPVDCKEAILKAKAVRNISCVAEFVALDKIEMMEEFYMLTGRGEYKPPKNSSAVDRTFNNSIDAGSSASVNTSTTGINTTPSVPRLTALDIVRNTLNIYGPNNYRRERINKI
jgi:hypothetical protein